MYKCVLIFFLLGCININAQIHLYPRSVHWWHLSDDAKDSLAVQTSVEDTLNLKTLFYPGSGSPTVKLDGYSSSSSNGVGIFAQVDSAYSNDGHNIFNTINSKQWVRLTEQDIPDTTVLKKNPGLVKLVYLKQLSPTNPNGGGRFVQTDSVYKEGGVAFDHLATGEQFVRTKFLASKDFVSAEWFGAVGDSIRHDNEASKVQAAIEFMREQGGGTVYVPAGKYITEAPIWIPSGVTLKGAGGKNKQTAFYRADSSWWPAIMSGRWDGNGLRRHNMNTAGFGEWAVDGLSYVYDTLGVDIVLEGIYVHGNPSKAWGAPASHNGDTPTATFADSSFNRGDNIHIEFVKNVTIKDVWSDSASNDGMWVERCADVLIENCKVTDPFLINPRSGGSVNHISIAGSLIDTEYDLVSDTLSDRGLEYFKIRNVQLSGAAGQHAKNGIALALQLRTGVGADTTWHRGNHGRKMVVESIEIDSVSWGIEMTAGLFEVILRDVTIKNTFNTFALSANSPPGAKMLTIDNMFVLNCIGGISLESVSDVNIVNSKFRNCYTTPTRDNAVITLFNGSTPGYQNFYNISNNKFFIEDEINTKNIIRINSVSSAFNDHITIEANEIFVVDSTSTRIDSTFTEDQAAIKITGGDSFVSIKDNYIAEWWSNGISIDQGKGFVDISGNNFLDVAKGKAQGSLTESAIDLRSVGTDTMNIKIVDNYVMQTDSAVACIQANGFEAVGVISNNISTLNAVYQNAVVDVAGLSKTNRTGNSLLLDTQHDRAFLENPTSYRKFNGDPGALGSFPLFDGEVGADTLNNVWYKAMGTTSSDWIAQ